MPHDANGQLLNTGHRVTIEFKVKNIQPTEDACNVSLEAVNPIGQSETYLPNVACNSRLTTLLGLILAICLLAGSPRVSAQSPNGVRSAPGVAASIPFSSPGEIVLSSRENLVPFSAVQLAEAGWSQRVDPVTGAAQWYRAVSRDQVMQQSCSDPASSRLGATAAESCGSCQSTLHSGGS